MKGIIVMGPTAAGKTALGLQLAKEFDGEIINADSRQIYRGMDIGTDKPAREARSTKHEIRNTNDDRMVKAAAQPRVSDFEHANLFRNSDSGFRISLDAPVRIEGIPHYLIDILTPDQGYSAAQFRDDARRVIADIQRRGKLPIVVGGTGFYLRVLTGERALPGVPPDPGFRAWAERQAVDRLADELRQLSPALYGKVDNLKNRRRVTRYLEVARGLHARRTPSPGHWPSTHGAPCRISEIQNFRNSEFSRVAPSALRVLKLALVPPPAVLRQRIESRVNEMFRRGLVDEVKRLIARYGVNAPGLQTTGYREIARGLGKGWSEEQTKVAVLRAHWQTARRQLTWLKREPGAFIAATPAAARDAVKDYLRR